MKIAKVVTIFSLSSILICSGTAHATDAWFSDDGAPQGKIGLKWVEDNTRGESLSYLQAAPSVTCSTLEDANCRNGNWNEQVILPPCSATITEACVDGMSVGTDGKKLTPGILKRTIDSPTIPAYPALKIPFAGSPSIWEVPGQNHTGGNNQYVVIASLMYSKGGNLQSFQAGIVPVNEVKGSGYQKMELTFAPGTKDLVFNFHIGNCVYQEKGNCGVAQLWQPGSMASLSLRVPPVVTGWMYGRLSEPSISVTTTLGSADNLITVSGKPVTVEGSKPLVDFPNIPVSLENFLSNNGGFSHFYCQCVTMWCAGYFTIILFYKFG